MKKHVSNNFKERIILKYQNVPLLILHIHSDIHPQQFRSLYIIKYFAAVAAVTVQSNIRSPFLK